MGAVVDRQWLCQERRDLDTGEMITLADRILVMRDLAITGEVRNDYVYATTSQAVIRLVHAEASRAL